MANLHFKTSIELRVWRIREQQKRMAQYMCMARLIRMMQLEAQEQAAEWKRMTNLIDISVDSFRYYRHVPGTTLLGRASHSEMGD